MSAYDVTDLCGTTLPHVAHITRKQAADLQIQNDELLDMCERLQRERLAVVADLAKAETRIKKLEHENLHLRMALVRTGKNK